MKKLLVAVAALGLAATANAGDYHKKETLRCSQCHTMHASRAHGLNNGTFTGSDVNSALPDPGNPHRKLLIQDGTNETCLACHDAKTSVPDVFGANGGLVTLLHRSAGALNGTTPSHTDGTYSDWMGHTLGSSTPPPGFIGIYEPTPVENFNCANCHAVHGSGAYRNLGLSRYMGLENTGFGTSANPFAGVGPTYNPVDNATGLRATAFVVTNDVTITQAGRDYETQNVQFGQGATVAATAFSDGTVKNGMNNYCAVCHGNFHGDANTRDQIGGIDFVRHPTSAIVRDNSTGTLLNGVTGTDLVRPVWAAAPGATANFEAACLTCHKGHGNARGYGLIYPAYNGVNSDMEQGDAAADVVDASYPIRNLCTTCHPMGRF